MHILLTTIPALLIPSDVTLTDRVHNQLYKQDMSVSDKLMNFQLLVQDNNYNNNTMSPVDQSINEMHPPHKLSSTSPQALNLTDVRGFEFTKPQDQTP